MDSLYREHILDHFRTPRHRGRLLHATASFKAWNPLCGDKIVVDLELYRSGTSVLLLKDMGWEGEGCAISLAAASMLSEEIIGKSVKEVQKLTYEDMLGFLKISLTPARLKCGMLAREGVKGALEHYART